MGGQGTLINLTLQGLPLLMKEESGLRTRSRESERSDMFLKLNPGNNSWFGKYLKLEKSQGDGDSQKTAVVDVHIRFSLSEPKSLAEAASRFAPPWFKLLKTAQPLLPLLLQGGGGGNRDSDFFSRLGYGGDDDSNKSRHRKRKLVLGLYIWWAVGVALTSLVVLVMRAYSGIPHRTQSSVSQFLDGVLWLGLMWCVAAFCLWTARMLISLTPSGNYFKAFSSGREFVVTSKVDEWMAHNVVAVPCLLISLFLVCDIIHYGKHLNVFLHRVKSSISTLLHSHRVGVPPGANPLFSRVKRRSSPTSAKRRNG